MKNAAIICVDDHLGILSSLGEQLRREFYDDYEIELVTDGEEALELCAELTAEGIDIPVVISDQQMPGIQGDQFLALLHAQYPQTLTIMLTGQSNMAAVSNAVNAANLYRFIPKPWDNADLILTVKEAIRRFSQDSQLREQQQALQQANTELARSLSLLQATLESTADGILVIYNHGTVTHCNQKLAEMWGVTLPTDLNQVLALLSEQLQNPQQFDMHNWGETQFLQPARSDLLALRNGRLLECFSQPQKLGQEIVGRVWSFRDVTERQKAESMIRYQANYDELTGLANRRQFNHYLSQFLTMAKLNHERLAVLFVDLDHFKIVNDSLGHVMGDLLLQQVVSRLTSCCRDQDIIARWGGDEFTIALSNVQDYPAAAAVAQRILAALQPSFDLEGHPVCITSSIGIALYPEDGEDSGTLLQNADTALYQAKEQGRNSFQYYTQTLNNAGQDRLALEYALNQALEREEFTVYYQPQIDTRTGAISHMEALARWRHPQLGFVSPAQFIPIAEQNGAIVALGRWVLQQACAQAKMWQQLGMPITVGVNLSPRQLRDEALLKMVDQILAQTALETHFLELEITESATLHNLTQAQSVLMDLHQMGIRLALDDFGTGYSSLSYLKQFPLDTLKIDRSFVMDLLTQNKDAAIAKAILELGRGLDLRVVAEGVETAELQQLLQNFGCRHMQGYLFSRPLPAQDATHLLQIQQGQANAV
jgi:diguanylate cyclase (GGDEF)-like protein